MSDQPTSSIPSNAEHVEARQAEINLRREERKASMDPAERLRLEVIEECSAKLEAAGVPFQLWAASDAGDEKGRHTWWCFHKHAYGSMENMDAYTDRVFESWQSLIMQLLNHQTVHANIQIAVYSPKSGRLMSLHQNGMGQIVPPPPATE